MSYEILVEEKVLILLTILLTEVASLVWMRYSSQM